MKRVFFYTGYHMEVFEFDRNALIGSLDFYDTDTGAEQLRDYIQQSAPASSYMLVDLQDEDFRNELVPHVTGRDRQQIIERLENKIFRDHVYHHTKALGRTRDGRKDDQFMFSSLLNVEALDKWMAIFEDLDVPICGIWSVSFLGERILKKIAAKDENLLLFSRQMRSAIRETMYRYGKIIISRQAKLERRIRKDKSPETLATILASNVDIMHRFLINQRVLNYMDVLNVYAIVKDDLIEKTKEYCEDSNTLKFKFVGIGELFKLFNIKNCENREADTLFAYLCTLEQSRQQQYLPAKNRAPYLRYNINLAVRNLTQVLSLSFMIFASFLLLNANEYSRTEQALLLKQSRLMEEHDRLYGHKQEQINSAGLIKETVSLMRAIEEENAVTPQALFNKLSRVFDQPVHQRFNLTSMHWQKYRPAELQSIASEYSDLSRILSEEEAYQQESFNVAYAFQPALVLNGHLDRTNLSYHQAVALMDSFTASLAEIGNVADLHILMSPIDVRIASKFADRSGLEQERESGDLSNTEYEVRLIFRPLQPAESDNELANY